MTSKLIVVGAPRSGTNMLRDVLARVPDFATWPCDEVNLLWRHGNRSHPSDELTVDQATPQVGSFMQQQFDGIARKYSASTVVEKTCANSLRVDFVDVCVPDARFVLITRDGIDAAASAMDRWNAPFDLRYTAAKARYVPPGDVPYYALRFARNRIASRRDDAPEAKVASWWGPKLDDSRQLMERYTLDELCAIQWQRCVDAALNSLRLVDDERVHRVVYEEFVAEPVAQLEALLDFIAPGTPVDPQWVQGVSRGSVGKGRSALGAAKVQGLEQLVGPTLARLGYA